MLLFQSKILKLLSQGEEKRRGEEKEKKKKEQRNSKISKR